MYFQTYNHETGSNNGGTARNAILEEIDEELAALLDDEDLGIKKKKKEPAEPLASDAEEEKGSPKVGSNIGKRRSNSDINAAPEESHMREPQAKQSTNSVGHYGRLTRAVFTE